MHFKDQKTRRQRNKDPSFIILNKQILIGEQMLSTVCCHQGSQISNKKSMGEGIRHHFGGSQGCIHSQTHTLSHHTAQGAGNLDTLCKSLQKRGLHGKNSPFITAALVEVLIIRRFWCSGNQSDFYSFL